MLGQFGSTTKLDMGEQEALTDDLEGLFVGDEGKDGEMEIY